MRARPRPRSKERSGASAPPHAVTSAGLQRQGHVHAQARVAVRHARSGSSRRRAPRGARGYCAGRRRGARPSCMPSRSPGPSSLTAQLEPALARASLDAHRSPLLARGDRVLERVLQQRLQQQARHQRLERGLLDGVFQAQPLAEAQPLGAQVQVERLELLAQGHLLHRILVERVAQEFRQARDRVVRHAVLVVEDEGRDGVQGVEQEVRVQLVAQHLQLRLLGERDGLQHRLLLLALRLVELDAEVQHAPAHQQVGRGQGAAEELEQNLCACQSGLDEVPCRRG